jgi:starch phosphorylase
MHAISADWNRSTQAHEQNRRACYFSMEFLVGRAVFNNLLCLGLYDTVEAALQELGTSLSSLEEIEDAALGNGGLGRLAACFLDSAATLDLPLDGYGIRYKYGLFKQSIVDGFQKEEPDNWMQYGDAWSVRCEKDAVLVQFNGQTVRAVPYDMPVIGCKTKHVGTLRLWQAEPVQTFDFDLFNQQKYLEAAAETVYAEDISRVLYPNDDTWDGKKLRLKQQYFFCAASLADILKKHKATYGTLDNLADKLAIQLNDTHPVISIPELIRLLLEDDSNRTFADAFAIAQKVFRYTNHTVMPEALEKWDCRLVEELLPALYPIIVQINEALLTDLYQKHIAKEQIAKMKIIQNGMVHMAHLAVYASSYTNGVAAIHTQILKDSVLADWYKIWPERFFNETNGITQRRWLALCNRELSGLLTNLAGSDRWMTDLTQLKQLEDKGTPDVLEQFCTIKQAKKQQLADFIFQKEGIRIRPDTIFDIQIKRLHEYKRQLLNAFSILYLYEGIKDGSIQNFTPTTFIFGAKSAPGYRRAKAIIKFINEVGKLIANDPDVCDLIQVVFVSNYNVSYAEKLVAAADVSEQISTAGTEASGTGNMKLMLNGAVTLGTYDGANVEIVEEAGEENNYIFGATVEELAEIVPQYESRKIFSENAKIRRVVERLIDGSLSDGGSGDFRELYYSLLDGASWHAPDHYYLLGDLESYVAAKLRCNQDYTDRLAFASKQWKNICNAGKFSSDRTIAGYAEDIWQITPVTL